MPARLARHRRSAAEITWPGFVDALSSLLLVIIFLLSVFALAQFFLSQALSGRDQALSQLQAQIAELGDLLRLERQANTELSAEIASLTTNLADATADRDSLQTQVIDLQGYAADLEGRLSDAQAAQAATNQALDALQERYRLGREQLAKERGLTEEARDEIARLQASINALNAQLASLRDALEASEARDKAQQAVIADLGSRLNVALAGKVQELAGYRSEFFGRLREVLGNNPAIRIEGDRFVFQSELLFDSGSAALGREGRIQITKVAATVLAVSATLPPDINWIIRVDGHTDRVPISTATYASNWELSAARAIAVVRFLINEGVPPDRLAATGFGEHQPLSIGTTPEDYRRNRRIEMRFDTK